MSPELQNVPARVTSHATQNSDTPPVGQAEFGAWIVAAVWAAVIALSLIGLAIYGYTPGALGTPASARAAGFAPAAERFTLAMAVHPMCPCTRASLSELEGLLVRCGDRLDARLLVYEPSRLDVEHWDDTAIDTLRARFSRAEVQADPGGAVAAALGSKTSGSVVLFDSNGEPCFWGGITPGRGHLGDNAGVETIVAAVRDGFRPRGQMPVYGCSLTARDRSDAARGALEGMGDDESF